QVSPKPRRKGIEEAESAGRREQERDVLRDDLQLSLASGVICRRALRRRRMRRVPIHAEQESTRVALDGEMLPKRSVDQPRPRKREHKRGKVDVGGRETQGTPCCVETYRNDHCERGVRASQRRVRNEEGIAKARHCRRHEKERNGFDAAEGGQQRAPEHSNRG